MDDSLTIGRQARYEMKDMGIPKTWCGIEFTFLPDVIIMHQAAKC